jgi:hypothetical protein
LLAIPGNAGSSEAMLSGQRPPFGLLLQAEEPDGTRCAAIPSAVSDLFVVRGVHTAAAASAMPAWIMVAKQLHAGMWPDTFSSCFCLPMASSAMSMIVCFDMCFQVATPRVRSASKPAIPKLSDNVSKLPGVGAATQVGPAAGSMHNTLMQNMANISTILAGVG